MKKIKLSKGKYALVDDEDYPYISRFSWRLIEDSANSHCGTTIHGKKDVTIYMEQFLIKGESFKVITHKNRNTLDNQKDNLLLVDSFVSRGRARKTCKPVSSIHKGVYWSGSKKRWIGRISTQGKVYEAPYKLKSENDLAKWYNKKARELYGEYAYQNICK